MGNRLQGKAAMITGAGSGVGLAMTRRFVEEGARVLAVDVDLALDRTLAEFDSSAGGSVCTYRCDVSDPDAVAVLGSVALDRLGGLDVLCNNAGIGGESAAPLHEYPLAVWDRVMAVNLRGAFLVLQQAL